MYKICTKCNKKLSINNFTTAKTGKDGRRSDCRNCRAKSKQIKRLARKNTQLCTECGAELDCHSSRVCLKCLTKSQIFERKYIISLEAKIRIRLRQRLYHAIKGDYKTGSAVQDLGCSICYFKKYIESKFTTGMSWDNYGMWHIDHIIPLSHFDLTDREQFLRACHYTNLQPLWAGDNLSKSNKFAGS